jgi:uncharacterized protein YjbI with pentapeptide repeats
MTENFLKKILVSHEIWLLSEGQSGKRANLSDATLSGANLEGSNLSGANLEGANLEGSNLSGANLFRSNIRWSNLEGSNLSGANLEGANIRWSNLFGANLEKANLCWSNLSGSNLSGANFFGSNLSGANLEGANLFGVNLSGANLSDATLEGANLEKANLKKANLSGSNLSGANGLLNPSKWMRDNLKKSQDGYITHKRIGKNKTQYNKPSHWDIRPGAYLEEVVNPDPTNDCGCGVNCGTKEWCDHAYKKADLWECLIECEDLPSVVVPYNTDGKFRCGRVKLIKIIKD